MIATGPHRCLLSSLTKLLEETGEKTTQLAENKKLKSKSINLFDFGARIKIVLSQQGQDQHNICLKIYFNQDCNVHEESLDYLHTLYGSSVTVHRLQDEQSVVLTVAVNDAVSMFHSRSACAVTLSQIRVQTVGAPIFKSFSRLHSESAVTDNNEYLEYKLGSYGKCGAYHCLSTKEK
jgi:hypothetical protein